MLGFAASDKDEDDRVFMKELYMRYRRLMFSTALRYVAGGHDCEDIVQDAVESLCGKVKKLRGLPSYALPVYISYTVKHTALNFRRRQAIVSRYTTELDGGYEEYESPEPAVEEALAWKEMQERLFQAWPLLPEEDQELLYRKYVLEETNEELADRFHCQKDSIRMRLTRARRKARACMEEVKEHDPT